MCVEKTCVEKICRENVWGENARQKNDAIIEKMSSKQRKMTQQWRKCFQKQTNDATIENFFQNKQ